VSVVVPIASGKGGTGKSIFALNLSIALALRRKTVVLVDLDLGGSNLHTLFGIETGTPGIGDLIFKTEGSLTTLLSATNIRGLHFIAGDSRYPAAAHLDHPSKRKISAGIKRLVADFVILDLGAGSFHNVIDFFLLSRNGFVIATPEATSILNAYSFLKTVLYRLLYLSFPPTSRQRGIIHEYMKKIRTKTRTSFGDLLDLLRDSDASAGAAAARTLSELRPSLVINMAESTRDVESGKKLVGIVAENLGISCDFAGIVPRSNEVVQSVLHRKPAILLDPVSRFSASIEQIARKLIAGNIGAPPKLYEDDDKLTEELIDRLSTTE
jgi:flagellar biosynthesis protein FlhG